MAQEWAAGRRGTRAKGGSAIPDLRPTILDAWKTNNRLTVFLVERLPPRVWTAAIPGAPRRTIRMIAGHIHNARCRWVKTLGGEFGIPVPRSVERRVVGRPELVRAMAQSSRAMLRLLTFGCDEGGTIPLPRRTSGAICRSMWGTCSPISSPTKRITADRSCLPPGQWVSAFPRR